MSIKSVYLNKERLNELNDSLWEYDKKLYHTLNNYLECNSNDDYGEYLVNIFTGHELYELSILDRHYNLFDDVDTILKVGENDGKI